MFLYFPHHLSEMNVWMPLAAGFATVFFVAAAGASISGLLKLLRF